MSSFNSPDNNSILDDSTPLPAILNHETPVRLNIPIEHNCQSSTILVLTRGSSGKQVKQVIANIQSPLHGYHHRETIDIIYAPEFQNLLIILYTHIVAM